MNTKQDINQLVYAVTQFVLFESPTTIEHIRLCLRQEHEGHHHKTLSAEYYDYKNINGAINKAYHYGFIRKHCANLICATPLGKHIVERESMQCQISQ